MDLSLEYLTDVAMSFPISRQDYNVAQSLGQTLSAQRSDAGDLYALRSLPKQKHTTSSPRNGERAHNSQKLNPPNPPSKRPTERHTRTPKNIPRETKKIPDREKKNTYTQKYT